MELNELKLLIGIAPEDNSQDGYLTLMMEAAIDKAKTYCRLDFLDSDGKLSIPPGIKVEVARYIKAKQAEQGRDSGIKSEKVGELSVSYFSSQEGSAESDFEMALKPYRLRKGRFI